MRFADSQAQGDAAWGDVPLSRPAVDPAVPRAARALLCAEGTPLTPASQPRPSRHRPVFLPQQPERRLLAVDHAVTGLTAAMAVAVTGSAPWAFGVLVFADPAGWQSATGHYALLLSELIVAVTMIVFVTRAALAGEDGRGRAAARAYHGRYLTGADLDAPARVLLRRAQDAADDVRSAAVSRAGLLDEVAADAALAAQEWDIALALREQARLRLRRAEAGDPVPGTAAAELLARHRDSARAAEASITRRVDALEHYAAEVRAADSAYRQRLQHAAIADLSAPHLDMLART
ncbi:MAG: hypothetical protein ACRDN0_34380, partial [Trebonia sp.]